MTINFDHTIIVSKFSCKQIESLCMEEFQSLKDGKVDGVEDNYLDVIDKRGVRSFGNLSYYRKDGLISGIFVWGVDGPDKHVVFSYPEEAVVSLQWLFTQLADKADKITLS